MSEVPIKIGQGDDLEIIRHKPNPIHTYEITDADLNELCGGGGHIELAMWTFFLTSALACFIALFTLDFTTINELIFGCLVIGCVVFLIVGTYFLYLWRKKSKDCEKLKENIKSRPRGD